MNPNPRLPLFVISGDDSSSIGVSGTKLVDPLCFIESYAVACKFYPPLTGLKKLFP